MTDTRDHLIQKTDRSGFIENDAFQELKRFAQDSLKWMARRRMEEAEARRSAERSEAPKSSEKAKDHFRRAIEELPAARRAAMFEGLEKYDRARTKEVQTLRKEVQLYRTLSTAGITAATFAHESSGSPLKVITTAARTVERRGRESLGARYAAVLEEPVGLVLKATDALKVLGNVTLSLLNHEKRRVGRVNVHDTILEVIRLFRPFLDGRGVSVSSELMQGRPYLRGSEAALESIVANLLNNSLVWLERSRSRERRIVIRTQVRDNRLSLRVLDSGTGIEGINKNDIWLPGETTRPGGTGLGLTIVRDTVKDLGGSTGALEHSELGGAEIVIDLPLLGS